MLVLCLDLYLPLSPGCFDLDMSWLHRSFDSYVLGAMTGPVPAQ